MRKNREKKQKRTERYDGVQAEKAVDPENLYEQ